MVRIKTEAELIYMIDCGNKTVSSLQGYEITTLHKAVENGLYIRHIFNSKWLI